MLPQPVPTDTVPDTGTRSEVLYVPTLVKAKG